MLTSRSERVTVNKKQLAQIRRELGRTQSQMAMLLGTSLKAIQSFEQGWRNIPGHAERQILMLLALKNRPPNHDMPCWEQKKCPEATRRICPAWEFRAGEFCWLILGTACHGKVQSSWTKKKKECRGCEVFRPLSAVYRGLPTGSGAGIHGDRMDRE
jgi:DNA-binding XRE family transcriptional regulator